MKNLTLILIILLMAAGVVIYLLIRERSIAQRDRQLEAREFRAKQNEDWAKLELSKLIISDLRDEVDSIIQKHATDQGRLKRQANASRARITGPPVVQDTVIIYLDSLVADLEQEKDTVYVRNDAIIDSLQRQVFDFSELFQGQLKKSMKMEGELEREKKKRIIIGPSVGIDYRGNPTISFGATYQLWKF